MVVAKADRSKMPEPVVTKGQKATRKDTLATRGRILDAAEQLFYQRGIDNVSLADINQAAGQKNRNALQYHFGDKTALTSDYLFCNLRTCFLSFILILCF